MRTRRWLVRIVLVALSALGLWLRLRHYGDRIPWVDELETHLYTEQSFLAPFRRAFAGPPVTTPPLYFALVRLLAKLHLAGAHERLPSVIAGAAAIPAVFFLARRYSVVAGLAAAALLCTSPLDIRYSQEARPYALLVLATIVFLEGAIRARDGRFVAFVIGGVSCALLQHAGIPLAALGIAWLWWTRRDHAALVAGACVAVACAVTTVQLLAGMQGGAAIMPHVSSVTLPLPTERALGIVTAVGTGDPDHPITGLALSLVLWLVGAIVLLRRDRGIAILWLAAALVPIVAMALPATRYPFFARYAIHAVPIGAALGGVAIAALAETRSLRFLAVVPLVAPIVAWIALSLPRITAISLDSGTRYDLVGDALRDVPAGQRVVMILYDEPLDYYAPQELAALRPYLRRDLELRAVSGWERATEQISPHDFIVTLTRPWPDAGARAISSFAPTHPSSPLEGLVLGRAVASTPIFLHAPLP